MRDLTAARSQPAITPSRRVQPLRPATRYTLRGAEAVRLAAGEALGVELPALPCRAVTGGERAALWLGPDEWLLLAPEAHADALAAALAAGLRDLPHSLVDVSHRQVALEVSGSAAPALLSAGCPLDLDESTFPAGTCTRTMLAKAEIVLWRTGERVFRIEVWRSFAAYVSQFLAEAARGMS